MIRINYELFSIDNCLNLYGKGIACECDADNQIIICNNFVYLKKE